ncbi:MAG TPA: aminotransferase class IV family protein [Spirochaetota bacterium]|nr:aminotransferase class IV family protein [Spirochaetota bacterium]HQH99429.1 aminotransferase class IV family protein [Spirochaetota bacterium]HQJ69961.1 aminotransferase class IV family protein [Spirochaetota bacterium]
MFESIRIIGGRAENLPHHNRRMNGSRKELFGCNDAIDLNAVITVPEGHREGRHKCKVVYSDRIHEVLFEPYPGRAIRSLKIVACDDIDYSHKYTDRGSINALFRLRGRCDDVLIVKNGLVTDTSISNIAFHDGSRWITPRSFLLRGTRRDQLISQGTIVEADIRVQDIAAFTKASLLNAMLDLGETVVETGNIVY